MPGKTNLRPIILDEIVEALKARVRREVAAQSEGPVNHAAEYDKYKPLVTQQAEEDAAKFADEPHEFDDMAKELVKYKRLSGAPACATALL